MTVIRSLELHRDTAMSRSSRDPTVPLSVDVCWKRYLCSASRTRSDRPTCRTRSSPPSTWSNHRM